jgi:PKD repeat protein
MKPSGLLRYLLILIMITSVNFVFSQVEIVLQPGPDEGKDTYINTFYSSGNGSTQSFIASAWTYGGVEGIGRSFIQFNLPVLPAEYTNFRAELSLYYDYSSQHVGHGGDNACKLERITSDWYEYGIDWYNQPSVTNQNAVYLSASATSDQSYPDTDVTLLIKDTYENPDNSFGFRLSLVDEFIYRSMILASSDHPDEMIRPRLTIRYDTCYLPENSFSYETNDLNCQFYYDDPSVTSWLWDFGNGYGSVLQNPSYYYLEAGTYNVCLQVENSCGSRIFCDSVVICDELIPAFTFIIENMNVVFTNQTIGGWEFYWDFGNGFFSTLENTEFQYENAGEYQVCLFATNQCRTASICNLVQVYKSQLSIDKPDWSNGIQIYPNPAKEEIFVKTGQVAINKLELYNLQGVLVEIVDFDQLKDEYRLPLQGKNSGIYFIKIYSNNGTMTRKLIVL